MSYKTDVELIEKLKCVILLLKDTKASQNVSENCFFLLDKALDHISKALAHESFYASLIKSPEILNFLGSIFQVSRATAVHSHVLVFALKLATLMSDSHTRFAQLEALQIFRSLRALADTTALEDGFARCTYLKFLQVALNSPSGLQYILKNDFTPVLFSCLQDSTMFTVKISKDILSKLLETSRVSHSNQCRAVLNQIGQVITKNEHPVEPYAEILQTFLEKSPAVTSQWLLDLQIEDQLVSRILKEDKTETLVRIGTFLACFYAKSFLVPEISAADQKIFESKLLKIVHILITRGYLRPALQILSKSLFYCANSPDCAFRCQILYLMFVPIMVDTEYVAQFYEHYDQFRAQWDKKAWPNVRTMAGVMEQMMGKAAEIHDSTLIVLSGFQHAAPLLDKGLSVDIFRALMYLFGCVKAPESPRNAAIVDCPTMVLTLINVLCQLVETRSIRWWESVESVCLTAILNMLLNHNQELTPQVACGALKALRFCITQFLHPNQALLVNHVDNSSFQDIAETLTKRIMDVHWEVRDSALEVVQEMAQLAHSKFPAFRNLLLDNKLIEQATEALNDSDAYVRASACAVVAQASWSNDLWQVSNETTDVGGKLRQITSDDTEALARRASAQALLVLFKADRFPNGQREELYVCMSQAAQDLDWLVKLAALEFWEAVMQETLLRNGLVDGEFPEIIFSVEKQKIVKLDGKEIKRRLEQVLTTLGHKGCLSIFLTCADDYDTKVKEKALNLLKYLRNLLAKYDALDLTIFPAKPKPASEPEGGVASMETVSDQGIGSMISNTTEEESDRVIDSIMDETDLKLASQIIKPALTSPNQTILSHPVMNMEPDDFMQQLTHLEFEQLLQQASLSSDLHETNLDLLMDDIVFCLSPSSNPLESDCY